MPINAIRNASTYSGVLNEASFFLEENKIESHIARWLLQERFSLTLTELMTKQREKMPLEEKELYIQDLLEAAKGRPPQYIVGHEWFFNRKFLVTEDTLIPRPETEEWFDRYIVSLPAKELRVLDIGTGSGVLAVSHQLERPQDEVIAVDIHSKALEIAKKNSKRLGAKVDFFLSDMTAEVEGSFDIVLSNPPYISTEEMNEMDRSVLKYEPKEALFAEDDGLFFYKQLALEIPPLLKPKGLILLECGYKQGEAVRDLFAQTFPDAEVDIWKDFNGLDRTIRIKM